MSKKKLLLYCVSSKIPSVAANTIQVSQMYKELRELINLKFIVNEPYDITKKLKKSDLIYFHTPFDSAISYHREIFLVKKVFHIFKKYEKNNDILIYTRSALTAYLFRKKTQNIVLEVHNLVDLKLNFSSLRTSLMFFLNLLFYLISDLPMKGLKNNIKIVVITKALKDSLVMKGFNPSNISVLSDSVDMDKFDIDISKNKARKELNLPLNKKIVMYTGTFQEWKGYLELLRVSRNFDTNVLFILIGGAENKISKLKKQFPKAILLPFVDHNLVPKYLKSADVLVLPNSGKYEISSKYTSPLKLFEYMASKRPIIASDLNSIREIVNENEVIFFKPDNHKDLKNKIDYVLKNSQKTNILVKNSYNKVKNYTWKKRAERVLDLFQK